jgi:hypothetical protein
MQYLMMDIHQRFIGTVVSINTAQNRDQNTKSVTVIPRHAAARSK